jgi:acid phosphatase
MMKTPCWLIAAGVHALILIRCPAREGIPRPDHVVIVVEENHAYRQIIGSPAAPYINALAQQGALMTESFGIRHPSQPNYLALFSGATQGLTDDSCPHAFGGPNLGRELLDAGWSFAGYSESMPTNGFTGCGSGSYARKHNPWVNFTNLPPELNRTLAEFPTNFDALPTVSFVIPNLANDMHDGSVARGDAWLRAHWDAYVRWAQSHNSLFILTWDEDDRSETNHIATIFVGPMVQAGRYTGRINHYDVLRTLEDMFDLPHANLSSNATPLLNIWRAPDSAITVALSTPPEGAVFRSPATIPISVTIGRSERPVERVEFFAGVTRLGERTASPYTWIWSNAPAGVHSLNARAVDDRGRAVSATPRTVSVLTDAQLLQRGQGVFNGLFYETNAVAPESAGAVALTITGTGACSGQLRLAGRRYAWRGQFDANGRSAVTLPVASTNALRVELEMDLLESPDVVSGRVTDGHWIAELTAKRAAFDWRTRPAPQAGQYTLLFPVEDAAEPSPPGTGYGTLSVDGSGGLRFKGALADGTPIACSSALAEDGQWALYASLYGGGGLAIGWMTFAPPDAGEVAEAAVDDLHGLCAWLRPPQPRSRFYPTGFTNFLEALGDRWQPPSGNTNRILNFTHAAVAFHGGNLPVAFTNLVLLTTNNTFVNLGSNRLTLNLTRSSGRFTGSATDPLTQRTFGFRGAVLQKAGWGAGYFLGTNQAGSVRIEGVDGPH